MVTTANAADSKKVVRLTPHIVGSVVVVVAAVVE